MITKGRRHSITSRIETKSTVLAASTWDVSKKTFVFCFEEMLLVAGERGKGPDPPPDLRIAFRDVEGSLVLVDLVIGFVCHRIPFFMMDDGPLRVPPPRLDRGTGEMMEGGDYDIAGGGICKPLPTLIF